MVEGEGIDDVDAARDLGQELDREVLLAYGNAEPEVVVTQPLAHEDRAAIGGHHEGTRFFKTTTSYPHESSMKRR
jgi:hypothetical protein